MKTPRSPYPPLQRLLWTLAMAALVLALTGPGCQTNTGPCESQADCGNKAYCYLALKRCIPLKTGFDDGGPPLPTTPTGPDEQGGACQQHQCEKDATRCTSSGWLSRCIVHTITGCRVWTPGSPCNAGLLCEVNSQTGAAACKQNSPYEAELQFCIDELNKYRGLSSLSPLARDPALEAFAARAAEHDAEDAKPHSYFNQSRGDGISRAENEIPGWPKSEYGSIKKVIEIGTKMMYNEGPGGGHHDNIVNPQFTKAGCGILVTPQGEVWITQEFR